MHLYCSPRYRAQIGLATPADLRRASLLHTTLHPHWAAWGQAFAPLSASDWASLRGVYFDQSSLALEAAKADQGVVLNNPLLAADDRLLSGFPPPTGAQGQRGRVEGLAGCRVFGVCGAGEARAAKGGVQGF